ncbi:hypothetical protein ABPG72_018492 [Tetrahymena utriculariae]
MNKLIFTFIAFLALIRVVKPCTSNADASTGTCLCSVGYWGVNAESGVACNKCDGTATTLPPSKDSGGNISSSATKVSCNLCPIDPYVVTPAVTSGTIPAAAVCTPCPSSPFSGTGISTPTGTSNSPSCCAANYYGTTQFSACPPNPEAAANTAVSATDCGCIDKNAQVVGNLCACKVGFYRNTSTTSANGCASCLAPGT